MNRLRMFPEVNNGNNGRIDSGNVSLKSELIETGKQYLKNTSIKGISKAAKTKSWFLMIVWILGTIAGLGCAVSLVFTLTSAYFNYNTVVKISTCTDCVPEFPDITVCNMNNLGAMKDIAGVNSYTSYINEIEQLFYNSSQQNITDFTEAEQEILLSLYSPSAYFNNIDFTRILALLSSGIGRNSFTHDCKW